MAVAAPAAEVAPVGAVAAAEASLVAVVGFPEGAAASAALAATWALGRASQAAEALHLRFKAGLSGLKVHFPPRIGGSLKRSFSQVSTPPSVFMTQSSPEAARYRTETGKIQLTTGLTRMTLR